MFLYCSIPILTEEVEDWKKINYKYIGENILRNYSNICYEMKIDYAKNSFVRGFFGIGRGEANEFSKNVSMVSNHILKTNIAYSKFFQILIIRSLQQRNYSKTMRAVPIVTIKTENYYTWGFLDDPSLLIN